jgi:hypothetical protein
MYGTPSSTMPRPFGHRRGESGHDSRGHREPPPCEARHGAEERIGDPEPGGQAEYVGQHHERALGGPDEHGHQAHRESTPHRACAELSRRWCPTWATRPAPGPAEGEPRAHPRPDARHPARRRGGQGAAHLVAEPGDPLVDLVRDHRRDSAACRSGRHRRRADGEALWQLVVAQSARAVRADIPWRQIGGALVDPDARRIDGRGGRTAGPSAVRTGRRGSSLRPSPWRS